MSKRGPKRRVVKETPLPDSSARRPPASGLAFELPSPSEAQAFSAPLLAWYRAHRRDLPWRRQRDPYAVWVSEVMLQQTQVATAEPFFRRWMRRFPTVSALAAADEASVLHAWQGLGYYSRARALLKGAREVLTSHDGKLPRNAEQLRSLPGIGPYTAGAIASIAFEQDEPLVDGNVTRVLTRAFALAGDPLKAPLKKQLWELAAALIPSGRARDFNQALMELGALVCTPRKPRCSDCPLHTSCQARAQAMTESYPQLAARPAVTEVFVSAALVRRKQKFLVVQLNPDAPRWASMWQFPNAELHTEQLSGRRSKPPEPLRAAQAVAALEQWTGLRGAPGDKLAELKHSVTRYRIHLALYDVRAESGRATARGCQAARWFSAAQLEDLAMPSAHRRLARSLVK